MISVTCQQTVRCPNCGSEAKRRYFKSQEAIYNSCSGNQLIQTECNQCDYLMIMCSLDGSVVEAYAPGTSIAMGKLKLKSQKSKKLLLNAFSFY